jgi:hypothetical protein
MPAQCLYERNHTGFAFLNVSSREAIFTITKTSSDYVACDMAATTIPGQRCLGGQCYPNLVGTTFTGTIDVVDISSPPRAIAGFASLGVPALTRTTVVPNMMAMKLTLLFPYRNSGGGSFSDFSTRVSVFTPLVVNKLNPTERAEQTFSFLLTTDVPYRPEIWFSDNTPKIFSLNPPFGPEEGGSIVTVNMRACVHFV